MTRVLVTGAGGFIGAHLARGLAKSGADVIALDRRLPSNHRSVVPVTMDICDEDGLRLVFARFRPHTVVHLAARTDLDESSGIRGYAANTDGVRNLLAAIEETDSVRRLVCASSQLVCRMGYRPTALDDYAPSTSYGESKVITEQLVRSADGCGREWCLVRPTTIWGPGMNAHYVRFLKYLRRGLYVNIGDMPVMKSYGYVENTVAQLSTLLTAPSQSINRRMFFLADDPPVSLRTWVEELRVALAAPAVRTISVSTARAAARIGDLLEQCGVARFPLSTFRVNNLLTSSVVDLSPTISVCGPSRISVREGAQRTAKWLLDVEGNR